MSRTCYACGAALEVTTRDGVDEITGPADERWYCPNCEPEVADRAR
jgi:uncharacterized protein with PIN domain